MFTAADRRERNRTGEQCLGSLAETNSNEYDGVVVKGSMKRKQCPENDGGD